MPLTITALPLVSRVEVALTRAQRHVAPEGGQAVEALLNPANLGVLSGTLALWKGSHLFGVGEMIDALLLTVGARTIGWSITDVAHDIVAFADRTTRARSDADLDEAAQAFARAVSLGGATTVTALVMGCSLKQIQAARGVQAGDAPRPRGLALPRIEPDPRTGRLWSRSGLASEPAPASDEGSTSPLGEVRLSPRRSDSAQALVRAHELVHRFLTPRFGVLRTFRVQLTMSDYLRSSFLQYVGEALTETVAQLHLNGFRGALQGIRFPVANGYMAIAELASDGATFGTLSAGTQLFGVRFIPTSPDVLAPDARYAMCV